MRVPQDNKESKLQTLNLADNEIGDEGAQALADMLKVRTFLTFTS